MLEHLAWERVQDLVAYSVHPHPSSFSPSFSQAQSSHSFTLHLPHSTTPCPKNMQCLAMLEELCPCGAEAQCTRASAFPPPLRVLLACFMSVRAEGIDVQHLQYCGLQEWDLFFLDCSYKQG